MGVALSRKEDQLFPSLLVAACHRDPGVTAFAQRHEVARIMGAAVRQRNNVVDFLRRHQPAFLLTLFAQRM